MYKKIMFILLTILFMSGSCDLGGKKSSISSRKAHTVSPTNTPTTNTPIPSNNPIQTDLTPISLVDTHKDAIKFDDFGFLFAPAAVYNTVQVKSVLIKTTDAALRVAGIASLSEAKKLYDPDKLKELIASLTFTIKAVTTSLPVKELTIKSDYKNLKIIYDGLHNNVDNPKLQPKLNINGTDVEFKDGYDFIPAMKSSYFNSGQYSVSIGFKDAKERNKMLTFLGDVLGINGIDNFKKYIP